MGDLSRGVPLPDYGTWCIIGPPKLETLILTESLNVDLHVLPSMVVMNTTGFNRFEYRNIGIPKIINSIVLAIPRNVSIDFSDNKISCSAPDVFNYSTLLGSNIVEVFLSGNFLAEQFEYDVNGLTFRQISPLKALTLSRNSIKSMSTNAFRHTVHLETLDLSQNFLRLFDIQISQLSQLTFLNVFYNLLTTLDSNRTGKLTAIFNSSKPCANLSINFTGNP